MLGFNNGHTGEAPLPPFAEFPEIPRAIRWPDEGSGESPPDGSGEP